MTEVGAPRRAGLRVALVGKGGAGKSAIAGTLARVLAQRGHRVLALDVDTLPGLAGSLGLSPATVGDAGLPEDVAERHPDRGWGLRDGVDVERLVTEHALTGPDGVRFLQLGKLPGRVKPGSTTAFRVVLEEFRAEGWTLVGDLAAGTRQPFFGWSDFAEVVLIVVDPSTKALLTARRLARLAEGRAAPESPASGRGGPILGLVANKLRTPADLAYIQAGLAAALRLLGSIPYDEALAAAERAGTAPIDAAPAAPAVTAIRDLAIALEHLTQQLHRGVQT
jgi:CO dehydrogenase maturation factor